MDYEYDEAEVLDILRGYEAAVNRLPDRINIYGEMENILDGRDIIEDHKDQLSIADLKRLATADDVLRRHAKEVYGLLGRDPKRFRERNNVPRSRWWWYVDEFSSFPRLLA